MTMVLNDTHNRTLKLGGKVIPPRGMEDVNMSGKDLNNHLFVRSGLIKIAGGGVKAAPKSAKKSEPEQPETGNEE